VTAGAQALKAVNAVRTCSIVLARIVGTLVNVYKMRNADISSFTATPITPILKTGMCGNKKYSRVKGMSYTVLLKHRLRSSLQINISNKKVTEMVTLLQPLSGSIATGEKTH